MLKYFALLLFPFRVPYLSCKAPRRPKTEPISSPMGRCRRGLGIPSGLFERSGSLPAAGLPPKRRGSCSDSLLFDVPWQSKSDPSFKTKSENPREFSDLKRKKDSVDVQYSRLFLKPRKRYMMAKSEKAFRRAALLRGKTARLFCHILIAMSIWRMILRIIRCQTCRLAAKSIEFSIDFASRWSL